MARLLRNIARLTFAWIIIMPIAVVLARKGHARADAVAMNLGACDLLLRHAEYCADGTGSHRLRAVAARKMLISDLKWLNRCAVESDSSPLSVAKWLRYRWSSATVMREMSDYACLR